MRKFPVFCMLLIAMSFGTSACKGSQRSTPIPTSTVTLIPTSTETSTATWTPTVTPTSIPTPTANFIPTKTPTATPTHIPTRTNNPTQTPFPTLPPLGPYLLYQDNNDGSLIMLGARGQGRRVIEFPKSGYIKDIARAVSPDGKWLAFYQRSNDCSSDNDIGTYQILCLIYLPDSSIHTITSLFPKDDSASKVTYGLVLDWSPDGKDLAFAGSMDSPLSDVYVYHIDTNFIQKLTDISVDIGAIDWSPDGKWIWFESISDVEGGVYEEMTMYLIDLNDPSPAAVKIESGLWPGELGWIMPDKYFLLTNSEGCCGPHNFRYINARTMNLVNLWGPSVASFAIDPDRGILAVSNAPEMKLHGDLFIDMKGKSRKFSDIIFWGLVYRGGKSSQFLGINGIKVVSIRTDGVITEISDKPFEMA